jgi:hypothetical protein
VGVAWLAEMRRLLAPGGVLRISTPDLEKYVRGYLRAGDGRTAENAETAEGEREDTAKSAKRDGRFFDEHRRRTTVAKHRGKPPGVVVVHIPPA